MPSYTSTTPVVLAVRDASTGKGIGLTCVRSDVRLLGIWPYLCQVGRTTTGALIPASDQLSASGRPRRRASCPKKGNLAVLVAYHAVVHLHHARRPCEERNVQRFTAKRVGYE
ncbi:hypothetical protein B296_00032841 [Ensete ventricosum]|uniref:Uncharacterized protein n=1 Tax=Ensete ventricosum TaxID=4639 RepID=A0A427ACM0_ENSVE|nr:hypothetical protein B296_00032841 [Ensete ventricosum]